MASGLRDNNGAPVFELSTVISIVNRALKDNGCEIAVVMDEDRYVGIVRRDELSSRLKSEPGLADEELGRLGELASPTLPEHSSPLQIRHFLSEHDLPLVPFTDRRGRLTRILSREHALKCGLYDNPVVVMAGGLGVRLRPITTHTPKPMIPLVDGTLLDRILDHLIDCGFYRYYMAVHYLKDQIVEYLGDGHDRDIEVEYIVEDTPMGTAGSLRELAGRESLPIVVTNGDVITNQRFGEILRFHREQRCQLTIVCKEDWINISYGVVECDAEGQLQSVNEKPRFNFLINTGMYVVEPAVLGLIPAGRYFMTDLINAVRGQGGRVSVFQSSEYWRDVGTIDSYAQVIKDIRGGLVRSLRSLRRAEQQSTGEAFMKIDTTGLIPIPE